jgi:hypothetical protein
MALVSGMDWQQYTPPVHADLASGKSVEARSGLAPLCTAVDQAIQAIQGLHDFCSRNQPSIS